MKISAQKAMTRETYPQMMISVVFIYLFVYLFVYLFIYLFIYLFFIYLFIYLFILCWQHAVKN